MSTRETRSRTRAATEEQPPPPTPRTDSGVPQTSQMDVGDSPASPSDAIERGEVAVHDSAATLAPSVTAPTVRSNASLARLRRLEEELKLQQEVDALERKEERRARFMIEHKLKIAREREQIELEQEAASQCDSDVGTRLSAPRAAAPAPPLVAAATRRREVAPPTAPHPAYLPPHTHGGEGARGEKMDPIAALAAEIKKLGDRPAAAPHPRHRDLPRFVGDRSEWMAFLASYRETNAAYAYTSAENMTRLRTALAGDARERVDALLFSSGGDPEEVIEALQRIYGRPKDLIHYAIKKILKTPPMVEDTPEKIDELACKVRNCSRLVRHFDSSYQENPQLLSGVLSRLTSQLRSKYIDYAAQYEHSGQPTLEILSDFLCREGDRAAKFLTTSYEDSAARAPRAAPATATRAPSARPPARNDTGGNATRTPHRVNTTDSSTDCAKCKKGHALPDCEAFQEMSLDERWDFVKQERLCFKCVRSRHRWGNCRAKPCGVRGCKRPHHKMLHQERSSATTSETTPTVTEAAADTVISCCADNGDRRAYLKIAPVVLQGPHGTYSTYALLDDGSTITLLESTMAQRIGARGPRVPLRLYGIGGEAAGTEASQRVTIKIRGRHSDTWHELTGARTVGDLGLGTQAVTKGIVRDCKHLRDIQEQLVYGSARPTVLIGQDNWHLLISRAVRDGKKNQPVASRTALGWVLHGFRGAATSAFAGRTFHAHAMDEELHRMVKENFAIDALGVTLKNPRIDSEERALATLQRTTKKHNGRYEVGLLWREENVELPRNEQQALTRLRGIEKKMAADASYAAAYRKNMKTLIESGYAERCPEGPPHKPVWYLPHFGVKNPNKPGKLRIVFDAAARTEGVCLNDKLLAGPDLLQSLLGVLLRFREGEVAVTADIKEMFLRVGVIEQDRDAQRFLWRDNGAEPIRHYRMKSLIFGAASSPCSALYIKNRNVGEQTKDAEIRTLVERSFYMDDCIHSTDDAEHASYLVGEVTRIQQKADFHLRGWASNSPTALQQVKAADMGGQTIELAPDDASQKTLGLMWDTGDDTLGFNLSLHRVTPEVAAGEVKPTKREMLSLVMSVFDPLGLLSPVITEAKALLQRVWASSIGWDDFLPDDVHADWLIWLHVFCDASSTAYAAVVYWRFKKEDGRGNTMLLAGKSRVAPLRPVSIPRLELQAAVLAVRLAETVKNELRQRADSTTYWSDSKTALSWIRANARRYKPFVAHRVAEIQETTQKTQWRWVPTKQNPADLATRKAPADFDENHVWFHGPRFLGACSEEWPAEETDTPTPDTGCEEEIKVTCVAREGGHPALPDATRFSSHLRLLRSTARVLQFIEILKAQAKKVAPPTEISAATKAIKKNKARKITGVKSPAARSDTMIALPTELIDKAERLWINACQQESFIEEIKLIESGKAVKKGRLASLAPHKGVDGTLRVGSRLRAAACVDTAARTPIILDARHGYVALLIGAMHQRCLHANNAIVINLLRQTYWILHLRDALRKIAHACQTCKAKKGKPDTLPFGDLPRARFGHKCRPFTYAGVDYFGPMEVVVGRRREKRWGALFTCLTTRAVHLELAASLSADSMLLALRRMVARRGTPSELWSDNATNFVGSSRELTLAQEEWKRLQGGTEVMRIKWVFIPPGAPNMGGTWERLVGAVKRALAITLRERAPKEEVLATLLTEAEHIVNSRPLTHIPADPEEEEALTPNHFLLGTASGAPTPCCSTERDLVGRATWRTAQRLADKFWSRWLREYVPTLAPRGKTTDAADDLAVGDIVLIADPTLPRNTWPRGRVENVFPGPDGRVRVVDVKTAAGQLRRPAHKLIQLLRPTSSSQDL